MGEKLIDLPDAPDGQSVEPAYDSRDVLMVDLMRSEGCPINDIVILVGAPISRPAMGAVDQSRTSALQTSD